jgi:hypothetical protein
MNRDAGYRPMSTGRLRRRLDRLQAALESRGPVRHDVSAIREYIESLREWRRNAPAGELGKGERQ